MNTATALRSRHLLGIEDLLGGLGDCLALGLIGRRQHACGLGEAVRCVGIPGCKQQLIFDRSFARPNVQLIDEPIQTAELRCALEHLIDADHHFADGCVPTFELAVLGNAQCLEVGEACIVHTRAECDRAQYSEANSDEK